MCKLATWNQNVELARLWDLACEPGALNLCQIDIQDPNKARLMAISDGEGVGWAQSSPNNKRSARGEQRKQKTSVFGALNYRTPCCAPCRD